MSKLERKKTCHLPANVVCQLKKKIQNKERNSPSTISYCTAPRSGPFTPPRNSYMFPKCSHFACSHGLSGLVQIVFQAPSSHNDQVTSDNYACLSIGLSAKEIHRRLS